MSDRQTDRQLRGMRVFQEPRGEMMTPTEHASSVESSLTIHPDVPPARSPAILFAVRRYRNLSLRLSDGLLIRLSNKYSDMLVMRTGFLQFSRGREAFPFRLCYWTDCFTFALLTNKLIMNIVSQYLQSDKVQ